MEYEGETFHLTEYQIKKTVKAFNYLDKKKRGLLKFNLLGSLLRCSGYNVSLKEIDKIKEKIIENKTLEKNAQVNEKRETEITTNENDGNNNSSNRKQAKKTKEDNDGDDHDDDNNISKMLSDLKNYDNFIELEKQKEEKKKKEEENKNLFSIKEFFRIIQLPNITNETKPSNVLNSFEIFDEKGNGRISIKKLRFILQYLGEPLSNADFDEFFDWIKTKDKVYKKDYIIYEDLINEMVNKDTSV
ncbi:calmodulin, putative [Plasmodium knowlesi strain H]|uniref:Calmodulin, putative n=3 Tax=Plasmodium knowlesi TaxID=5850 RepID=A0A5E7X6M5_PLAKH|nr:calmodulin, putative [Plasmodium knowlesi strain H]OTN63897.1 putative Calmodulin [Plasmodium knowlesi]CAA9990833.1 calmodulin, putative [Plasmodium knowlesi strain H]SBO21473.1 calmodulin, putative [Plasmodium knowlesi strain H]VVS80307.1 calmodulin, putative [Plasmodium knowlesi strain H]